MKWFDLVSRYRYTDERAMALVMAQMWIAAANSGNSGLLSTLLMNTVDAYFVSNTLDYAGVQVNGWGE